MVLGTPSSKNMDLTLPSVAEELLREIKCSYCETSQISDEHLLGLKFIFGPTALYALDLVDQRSVTHVTSPSGRSTFQVTGSSGKVYTCYKACHYCSCPAFSFSVLRRNDSLMVESQPILWDAAEEGYCDRHQTKDAWTLVCRNLYSQWDSATINEQEVIIKDVKNRWRTVRDRFKKYLNKQEQSGSSPCNKKCPYYDELQFLLTSRELRPSEGNIPPPRQTSSEEFEGTSVVVDSQDSSFLETCEDQDGISTSQSSSQAASQSQENNTSTTQVAPRRVNRRRNRSSAQPSVEIEALSSMIQRVEKEDEFDHIGVSLANRIRSLPKQRQPSFMAAMYTLLDAYENPSPIASVSAICKHILAVYLSQAIGCCQDLSVSDKQMSEILLAKED